MALDLLYPEFVLVGTGLFVLLIGLFINTKTKKVLGFIASLGILTSLVLTLMNLDVSERMFSATLTFDALSQFFKLVFLSVALLVSFAAIKYTEGNSHTEEFYSLMIFATTGMMFVASANDLIVLFVAFELASLATYALAGFEKNNSMSLEASIKYFMIGSLSAALLLFGITFIYGATGTTNISGVAQNINTLVTSPMGLLSVVLMIAGLGFKIALVPFHMWAPDTYQGSPSVVSALLSSASKKMGFIAAFKVFMIALIALKVEWQIAFTILAVLTMTMGNLVALSQSSVKRMLAYSSVAQAGYISMAFIVMNHTALTGAILYTLSHGFMKAGAFIATAAVTYMVLADKKEEIIPDHISNFIGLGKRMPITALCMTVFLLALAGIPFTAGFISKYVLFSSTIEGGYAWLAVIAIINSAVSLFYYAKVIMNIYSPTDESRVKEPFSYTLALVIATILVIVIGIWPAPFIYWAGQAANVLLI